MLYQLSYASIPWGTPSRAQFAPATGDKIVKLPQTELRVQSEYRPAHPIRGRTMPHQFRQVLGGIFVAGHYRAGGRRSTCILPKSSPSAK